jgi:hypothetical protein
MSSPAHRAALGFLRGGLIAAVSLALTPAVGAALAAVFQSGLPAGSTQFIVPLAGFVVGGAVGGGTLGLGARGSVGFGCGGGASGLLLLITAPQLQGLTGFEDPLVVVPYAVATSALAFGMMGLAGSLVVGRGKVARVAALFAVGGIAGGLLGVLPFLIQHWGGVWWAELWVFLTLAGATGSVAVPFVAGGAAAARSWSSE